MTLSEYEEKTKQLTDFLDEMEKKLKKISEGLNKKPREFWIIYDPNNPDWECYDSYGKAYDIVDHAPTNWYSVATTIIHVKEVIE